MGEALAFEGVHCETVTVGTLLRAQGIELSEPMLFGLGAGLSFLMLNLSSLPLPFLAGRSRPFELTRALTARLGVECVVTETRSARKAQAQLVEALGAGPVGLQLDCYELPYFERAPHFAGHFVAALAACDDGERFTVVDTVAQGGVHTISREALSRARLARGPMAANARMFVLRGGAAVDLREATRAAWKACAEAYLNPKFSGMGARGIHKLAASLPGWASASSEDLRRAAQLMERAGTGGGLFRRLYRDFLDEAAALHPSAVAARVVEARDLIGAAAEAWSSVAADLEACAGDRDPEHLDLAASRCAQIASLEVQAMRALVD